MRIIAGALRSRPIKAPRSDKTRPTTDRAREALFNVLTNLVSFAEIRVLDLFAGTGALAFEAISRGAGSAVLVEQDREARSVALANARDLGINESVTLIPMNVLKYLERNEQEGFDIVFADPPYEFGGLGEVATRLIGAGWVRPEGVVVLEHRWDAVVEIPTGAGLLRELKAGEAGFTILRKLTSDNATEATVASHSLATDH